MKILNLLIVAFPSIPSSLPNFHREYYLGTGYYWWLDMMIHGGYYFLVSLLLYFLYSKEKRPGYLFVSILLVSYILELAQKEVPGRTFSALDFLSNTLGVGMAFAVCVVRKELRAVSRRSR